MIYITQQTIGPCDTVSCVLFTLKSCFIISNKYVTDDVIDMSIITKEFKVVSCTFSVPKMGCNYYIFQKIAIII